MVVVLGLMVVVLGLMVVVLGLMVVMVPFPGTPFANLQQRAFYCLHQCQMLGVLCQVLKWFLQE
jgi:hypothetical protein